MSHNYIIYGLFIAGILCILSNFVDTQKMISKLFIKKNRTNTMSTNKEEVFLHIISLWYQLKEQCDACKLTVASDKLDEVFPLLNGVLDDEKTT